MKPVIRVQARRSTVVASSAEVETSHHAASVNARDMRSWGVRRISPDAALMGELDRLAGRADDLARNNGVASGAERTLVDNVIGPRFNCKPTPDRVLLKKDPEWLKDWQQQVEGQWRTYADTVWFDAGLRHTFHDMTRLVVRSLCHAGEALALPLWVRDDSKWKTRMLMIDPARMSTPRGMRDGRNMRMGVEVNPETGAPVAYHIAKSHPNDGRFLLGGPPGPQEWTRVPAYWRFGRARVLHVFEADRVGQSRGRPIVTAVMRQFKMLDHYHREQLRQAVLDSLVFAALKTPMDQATIEEMMGAPREGDRTPMDAYFNMLGEWQPRMEGGTMMTLPPGTELDSFSPTRSPTTIDKFTTVMLRHIATGLNMPYELLFRDFSQTNYSSARAAILEAWRYFLSLRDFVAQHWATPCYELWFEEAVHKGQIPDCTPADYYANQVAWTRCKWIGTGRGWVDPLKEAKAATERINNGTSTMMQEIADQGGDYNEVFEQRALENQRAAELGLPLPHVQTKVSAGPGDEPEETEETIPNAR